MKNRNITALLLSSLFLACAVDTTDADGVDAPAEITPPAPTTPVPPSSSTSSSPTNGPPPNCYPDVAYEIDGELVIVPGYCLEKRFERPVIGDPDPMSGLDDVSVKLESKDD